MSSFDLIVIGAGPGGYVCAIRAAQLGMKVAIVEKRGGAGGKPRLGGTCLNVGCIPSKALLDSSEHFWNAKKHFAEHGIAVDPRLDVAQMMRRKDKVVSSQVGGLDFLMKKNRIEVLAGIGAPLGSGRVAVTAADGAKVEHAAKHIVLAMGSVPIELPFLKYDGVNIVSSDHAIAFPSVPKRLLIVGGGVIGLELGSVWSRLGAEVTVIEFLPQICPFLDADVAKELTKVLTRQGLAFHLQTKVSGATVANGAVTLVATGQDGKPVSFTGDAVLVAVGRRPLSDGLESAGVALDDKRRVVIDHDFRTSVPDVYAIGDLVAGPMLAHKAEEEGSTLAEVLAGQVNTLDHDLIPNVVYTWPEVATVGLTEADAAKQGRAVKVGRYPFAPNGRAKAAGEADGFVKIIADAKTDRVLGCAIIGARASDLIAEAVSVMAFGGSSEDIARTCHAHPTFSEVMKEAALDVLGRAIHA
ncbi:MAG: dihydrolipoyl dehydrogenase [Planctomycetes bacterium]|nr:dihydrolipoyl dehydrogenase [Planctomycetota bacterium]